MKTINEGRARLYVSKDSFYNPKMSSLRDISIAFLRVLHARNKRILDSTAATGVRGIRYALESGAKDVTLLDINGKAAQVAKKNVELNGLKLDVVNCSIQEFANSRKGSFEIIDHDPFGSPAPNMFDIMKMCWDGTVLMITATDTAVLCGAHEGACIKIYGSRPLHNEMCKEAGVRILLNYISRTASQFNFGIVPMLSISDMHYMRIFLKLEFGAQKAIDSVKSNGLGTFCRGCYSFGFGRGVAPQLPDKCGSCGLRLESFGPLWLGRLYDKIIVSKMLKYDDARILETINGELDTPLFYSVPRLTKALRLPSVSHYKVMDGLRRIGKTATLTQFDPNGIKTDADSKDVVRIVRRLGR